MRQLLAVLCVAVLLVACGAPQLGYQPPLDPTPMRHQADRPMPTSTPVLTPTATATPMPATAPLPTPRWTAATPTPDTRTARQWVDEFVLCTSKPYSADYERMFVEDPMPALDKLIADGALGETLWSYFYEHANPDRFNSVLYIGCVYDVEFPNGTDHDLNNVEEGYEETVCNRMDWLGLVGYDVLKGHILELYYNTVWVYSC